MFIPESTKEEARKLAAKICLKVAKHPFTLKNQQSAQPITVSIGVAIFPEDAEDIDEIISLADKRLYVAKAEGRNRVVMG